MNFGLEVNRREVRLNLYNDKEAAAFRMLREQTGSWPRQQLRVERSFSFTLPQLEAFDRKFGHPGNAWGSDLSSLAASLEHVLEVLGHRKLIATVHET